MVTAGDFCHPHRITKDWLFAIAAALAAPADCSVNTEPTQCKRALLPWPAVGEEEGNFSISLHGFLTITENSLFATTSLSLSSVELRFFVV